MYTYIFMSGNTCMYAYTCSEMYTHIYKPAHVYIHTQSHTILYSVPYMCEELIKF